MDIGKMEEVRALDEVEVEFTVYQKDGSPYMGPDGETPCTISVVGEESQRVMDADAATQRRMLHQRKTRLDPKDILFNRVFRASSAVTKWTQWTSGDDFAECTKENVRMLLQAPHILTQVEGAITGHSDFSNSRSET
jgi:hypothetical protein